jgi:hypothetical protein
MKGTHNPMSIRSAGRIRTIAAGLFLLASPSAAVQQQHDSTTMNTRGAHVMGFDQTKTTHHFTLTKTGGSIQVEANDPSDTASLDHISMHLEHISKAFAQGDFTDPHDVHAEIPPGVPEMKAHKDKITYQFESTPTGAKVIIITEDPKALKASHDYLRYQIREHKAGDPSTYNDTSRLVLISL